MARGDEKAFERLYDVPAGKVSSLVRRVVRDHAQSEEVPETASVLGIPLGTVKTRMRDRAGRRARAR